MLNNVDHQADVDLKQVVKRNPDWQLFFKILYGWVIGCDQFRCPCQEFFINGLFDFRKEVNVTIGRKQDPGDFAVLSAGLDGLDKGLVGQLGNFNLVSSVFELSNCFSVFLHAFNQI